MTAIYRAKKALGSIIILAAIAVFSLAGCSSDPVSVQLDEQEQLQAYQYTPQIDAPVVSNEDTGGGGTGTGNGPGPYP